MLAKDVFDRAEMIIKVKEPQTAERKMLRKGQVLFTYLRQGLDVHEGGITHPVVAKDLGQEFLPPEKVLVSSGRSVLRKWVSPSWEYETFGLA